MTLLRTLVLCDLAQSTALIERLGDQAAAELIRRHDRIARSLLERYGGREVHKSDGFLLMFERPFNAVTFALQYQRELLAMRNETGHQVGARVGIHVGEVIVCDNSPAEIAIGAKQDEVEGMAINVAARLMGLARPGQILLSSVAYTLARRAAEGLQSAEALRWVPHGSYRFNGVREPLPVFEVGEVGIAPLLAPLASDKGRPLRPWWKAPALLAGAAATLAIGAGLWAYQSVRNERPLAFGERDWVVIGDVVAPAREDMLGPTLSTMFRLGLEQSRFVNVVPDGQVRQSLSRMQRDRGTRIDREVGSEIALREHARALIIPSVTQYGKALRLSAELIDPNGARTVFVRTADADAPEKLLPTLDHLLQGVRAGLGESLGQIQSSPPLAQVTTGNIEALRLYSKARRIAQDGDIEQALGLLSYATQLDPGFASAYAAMGSLYFTQQRYDEARAVLDKALSIEGRLPDRERLFIRAQGARFTDPATMAESWQTYAHLYPDQNTGLNNLGNVRYVFLLDYPGAQAALSEAAAIRAPLRNFTMQTLGEVFLAQQNVEQAEAQFRAAQALSPAVQLFGLSDVLVVQGNLEEAARYLDTAARQSPAVEVERTMRRATLLIARDNLAAASAAIADLLPQAARLPTPNPRWRAVAALIALHHAQGQAGAARSLAAQHLEELVRAQAQPSAVSLETTEHLLYAAGWAARLGMLGDARRALAVAQRSGEVPRFPVRARLAELLAGEIELAAGQPRGAAALAGTRSEGGDLWESHELKARALRASSEREAEATELRWLASHDGLAHAQWIDALLGQQARAIALRDAKRRLAEYDRRS